MQNPTTKIKFAILGYGHIGKKHASILIAHDEVELVAIIDQNPFESPKETIQIFSSLESFLEEKLSVDVVVIATPNGLHAKHAIACLNSGKHVVVEKPIALNHGDAEAIFRAAEENQREVFVVFQNRFAPSSIWLKEVLINNQLGKIYLVQVNCFWNRDQRYYNAESWHGSLQMDGGTLFTQFSHFIDSMYWFFGGIKNIHSNIKNYSHQQTVEFEDTGVISFELESGGNGSFQFTTAVWDKNLESTITIIAEKGTIKIGGQYMDEVSYCHAENVIFPTLNEEKVNNHQPLIDDIVQRIKNKKPSKISRQEVIAVLELIEGMYAATKKNHL